MSGFRPTPDQRRAIDTAAAKYIVSAAAGSGKTSTLTETYMSQIRLGIDPDQILAVTFTRKAAAEMRGRIVQALRAEGRFDLAQKAELGAISTIDSCFDGMLREYSLLANVDPNFLLVAEDDAADLQRDAGELALEQLLSAGDEEVRKLVGVLSVRQSFRAKTPYDEVYNMINHLVDRWRGNGLVEKELEQNFASKDRLSSVWVKMIANSLEIQLSEFTVPALMEATKRVSPGRKAAPSWFSKNDLGKLVEQAELHAALARLAAQTLKNYRSQMEKSQEFDRTEVSFRVLELFRNSKEARRAIQSRYRVLLVDEAQDLNRLQWEIFGQLGISKFGLFGDSKQSIYSFRFAEPKLFSEATSDFERIPLYRNLRTESAVLQYIDRLFKQIWGTEYTPMAAEIPFDLDQPSTPNAYVTAPSQPGVEHWIVGEGKPYEQVATGIQKLIESGVSPNEILAVVHVNTAAEALNEALVALDIPTRTEGRTRKFFARSEVRDIANLLRAIVKPQDRLATLSAIRGIADVSMTAITVLALQPNLVAALQHPPDLPTEDLKKVQAFAEWFLPLLVDSDRKSCAELVGSIYARSGYFEKLIEGKDGVTRATKARKLLSIAASKSLMSGEAFADHLVNLRRIEFGMDDSPTLDSSIPAVTIATVHKAKGLEYPVVVYADAHRVQMSRSPDFLFDPRTQLFAMKLENGRWPVYKFLQEQDAGSRQQEQNRVHYVAMTRAKRKLFLTELSQKNEGVSAIAAKIFGSQLVKTDLTSTKGNL